MSSPITNCPNRCLSPDQPSPSASETPTEGPRQDYLHVCIVLDASGSMSPIAGDVKGTFNSFVAEQSQKPGKTVLDVYQFDSLSQRIVRSVDLASFENNVMNNYACGGLTALNDAVCQAIDEIGAEFAALPPSERPGDVVFAILTDGEENASQHFTNADVKERVRRQTQTYSWNFLYLAANIDAFATGQKLGFSSEDCAAFEHSSFGVQTACAAVSERLEHCRRRRS